MLLSSFARACTSACRVWARLLARTSESTHESSRSWTKPPVRYHINSIRVNTSAEKRRSGYETTIGYTHETLQHIRDNLMHHLPDLLRVTVEPSLVSLFSLTSSQSRAFCVATLTATAGQHVRRGPSAVELPDVDR